LRRLPAGSAASTSPACARAAAIDYDVHANWKLVFQNFSECLHCPIIHPGLAKLTPYTSGENDLFDGPYLGGYMVITAPGGSLTMSGRACGPAVGDLPAEDQNRVYFYTIFPNLLLSLHPDYVMFHTLWPQAPDQTRITCEWLFHPDAFGQPGFRPGGRCALLGRDQPAGLAHLRAEPRGDRVAGLPARGPTRRARAFQRRGTGSS